MKTIEDLKKLIPIIVDEIAGREHIVGESYAEQDENGVCMSSDYEYNVYYYEQDGWSIEIIYKCSGEWDDDRSDYLTSAPRGLGSAWGEVDEINAFHYDDVTREETEFSDADTAELWKAIDKVLEDIA